MDLGSYVGTPRRLNTSPGEEPFYNVRWDVVPGSTVGKHINIADIAALVSGATGYAPMFGGARSYGRTCPFPP